MTRTGCFREKLRKYLVMCQGRQLKRHEGSRNKISTFSIQYSLFPLCVLCFCSNVISQFICLVSSKYSFSHSLVYHDCVCLWFDVQWSEQPKCVWLRVALFPCLFLFPLFSSLTSIRDSVDSEYIRTDIIRFPVLFIPGIERSRDEVGVQVLSFLLTL